MLFLADIITDSIVDGPGIRTTIFSQGCPHHCVGCHNPETWTFEGGTALSEDTVLDIVHSNPLCRGVTFSGGEPFAQAEAFAVLARRLKAEDYEIASYSGYTFEELLSGTEAQKDLLSNLDVLIDGPFLLDERSLSLSFRGSKNQRILDVPESLKREQPVRITQGRWAGEYI